MSDVDPRAALRPALDAFRRGTKRSRLRLFVAVCDYGHTLLEVFPTAAGPAALWAAPERWGLDTDGSPILLKPPRKAWQAAFVGDPDDATHEDAAVICRCTEGTSISLQWAGCVRDKVARAVVNQ